VNRLPAHTAPCDDIRVVDLMSPGIDGIGLIKVPGRVPVSPGARLDLAQALFGRAVEQ